MFSALFQFIFLQEVNRLLREKHALEITPLLFHTQPLRLPTEI